MRKTKTRYAVMIIQKLQKFNKQTKDPGGIRNSISMPVLCRRTACQSALEGTNENNWYRCLAFIHNLKTKNKKRKILKLLIGA